MGAEAAIPKRIRLRDIPTVVYARGLRTAWVVTQEANDADQVIMGICRHEPDMDDLLFDPSEHDEIFYCAKGKLKVLYDDGRGHEGELTAEEGEVLYLPKGYAYTLTATGIKSLNVFSTQSRPLSSREYANRLRELRPTISAKSVSRGKSTPRKP